MVKIAKISALGWLLVANSMVSAADNDTKYGSKEERISFTANLCNELGKAKVISKETRDTLLPKAAKVDYLLGNYSFTINKKDVTLEDVALVVFVAALLLPIAWRLFSVKGWLLKGIAIGAIIYTGSFEWLNNALSTALNVVNDSLGKSELFKEIGHSNFVGLVIVTVICLSFISLKTLGIITAVAVLALSLLVTKQDIMKSIIDSLLSLGDMVFKKK